MKLVLIRGLPGSGKTTMAKSRFPDFKHFEADQYFTDSNGNYVFVPSQIKDAHATCQNCTELALMFDQDAVVSNTFTQVWEMQPYIDMAKKYGYELEVITATGEYESIHNVPKEAIARMRARWEAYP